CQQDYSWPLTF
nr:immunoglobulin light chain junction region [Macaca mulatta]MOV79117.1 immunoglobulin light chain junction region [Macaca mulatta]MOV79203.1 immunoglobulin light chain junction region [Macaca mulatta]MOV80523.1 immunoglobulin light chain junction region [Macaca mulatta]MOV81565.1 immunoglobulin light chain junction region [Macaca mulatta]